MLSFHTVLCLVFLYGFFAHLKQHEARENDCTQMLGQPLVEGLEHQVERAG